MNYFLATDGQTDKTDGQTGGMQNNPLCMGAGGSKKVKKAFEKCYCRSRNVRALLMNINSARTFLAVTVSYLSTPKIANINSGRNALICQNTNIYSSEHKLIYSIKEDIYSRVGISVSASVSSYQLYQLQM